MKPAIAALLAAMSLLLSGCFQNDPAAGNSARPAAYAGITSIYRPFSPQAINAIPEAAERGALIAWNYDFPFSVTTPDFQPVDWRRIVTPALPSRFPGLQNLNEPLAGWDSRSAAGPVSAMTAEPGSETAGLVLDLPFRSLFAGLLNGRQSGVGDDLPNPFAEARKKIDAEKAKSDTASAETTKRAEDDPSADHEESGALQQLLSGAVGNPRSRLLFLGDLDGSGILTAAYATRNGDVEFAFEDASRSFVIFNLAAAVESQRSFAFEDMDGDGNLDILTTSREGLFGAVLLGDGDGGFRVADTFLTGYEPVVAVPGPMNTGGREILLVNSRTGSLTVLRNEGHYRAYGKGGLSFVPDYVTHLAKSETAADYFMASQSESTPRLYEWSAGLPLAETGDVLPAEPGLSVEVDPQWGMGRVQLYQVGDYASVILTDNSGRTFNVANLRVGPGVFLVFGDIGGYGTLDAGLAFLKAVHPAR